LVRRQQDGVPGSAYKYMLNACRIPAVNRFQQRSGRVNYHAVVARHGYFLPCHHVEESGVQGTVGLTVGSLKDTWRNARRVPTPCTRKLRLGPSGNAQDMPNSGWLTSSNQTIGAREILCQIQIPKRPWYSWKVVPLLCLDDEEPVSRQECGQLFVLRQR
jgi:hypothetical protein